MAKVSIVIPLYFCDPSLYSVIDRCFKSLEGLPAEIVVVDDCSPLLIPSHWPVTVQSDVNQGFTKTVATGMRIANSGVIVVMNDDIVMTPECFERFESLDPESLTIASPADTASSPDDRFGSCWGITRTAYTLLGGLDEKYRNFFSDTEYYNRAKSKGVDIIKWHNIILSHPESSTYKLLNKKELLENDRKLFEG